MLLKSFIKIIVLLMLLAGARSSRSALGEPSNEQPMIASAEVAESTRRLHASRGNIYHIYLFPV